MFRIEHHCPLCSTPLGSEKGKRCIGEHVEWCNRYHGPMRKGQAKRCQYCHMIDEQHEKRHREIAKILLEMREQNQRRRIEQAMRARSKQLKERLLSSPRTTISKKKEKKAAKKIAKAIGRKKLLITVTDVSHVAKALHPPRMIEERDNQENEAEYLVLTSAATSSESDIQETLDRLLETFNLPQIYFSSSIHRQHAHKTNHLLQEEEFIEDDSLISLLISKVKEDLARHRDEQTNTACRKEEFYKWAGRKAEMGVVKSDGRGLVAGGICYCG